MTAPERLTADQVRGVLGGCGDLLGLDPQQRARLLATEALTLMQERDEARADCTAERIEVERCQSERTWLRQRVTVLEEALSGLLAAFVEEDDPVPYRAARAALHPEEGE